MKYVIITAIGILTGSFLLAQGVFVSSGTSSSKYPIYNPNTTPPPIGLSEAYARAQAAIGGATNTFYCVTASCIERTNSGLTGWTFIYANTNGQRGRVNVSFDGAADAVAGAGEVLIQR